MVPSEGQPPDDSQATRLNDLDCTEEGSVSSLDNSEDDQGNSGFDEEDSVGSFIKGTAGAEEDWDRSPSSETRQQQQLASTPQANHLWQHQQQQECLMLIFLGSSSNQLVHLRPTIFGSSKLQCLTLIFIGSSSSELVHLRPIIFDSSKLQRLTLIFLGSSSGHRRQVLLPIITTPHPSNRGLAAASVVLPIK